MKKRTCHCLAAAALLCAAICVPHLYTERGNAYTEVPAVCDADLPIAIVEAVSPYGGGTNLTLYSAEEAAQAGVPAGYEGQVACLQSIGDNTGGGIGLTVDFSAQHIPVAKVTAIHFKVWVPAETREVRVTTSKTGALWQMRYTPQSAEKGTWITRTLRDGSFTQGNFDTMKNDEGNLGAFEVGFRLTASATAYIDGITVDVIEDKTPPVLSWQGGEEVHTTAGRTIASVLQATAYDAEDKRNVAVSYVWANDGAEDADGKLCEGTHALTLRAEDSAGNIAQKSVTVIVTPQDKTPPEISIGGLTHINAVVGSYIVLVGTATDNACTPSLIYTWSLGAVDVYGKLCEGTHTLTLTATDDTGNTASHTVTVRVYASEEEFLVLKDAVTGE